VVTATPAVVDGWVYVGDWSGRFYALDRYGGREFWHYDIEPHDHVYAGQIVSSAAVGAIGRDRYVYFGGGKTLYALDAITGDLEWSHELNPEGADPDTTEIESSPVVVDGPGGRPVVIFGYDVHNTAGLQAGVRAVDAETGELVWDFDPDEGAEPTGCVDVWSSPSVDEERRLVFAGSGNCTTSPEGWGTYTEAIFAVDLDTGEPQWSYQPHEPNNDDLDFAGAPNLYTADGQDLVGLGNKDGHYYAVDRETGEEVWDAEATEPGLNRPGSNFSTGGFIGPTAVADGTIVGGTAVGPCPCLHAIDAATGEIRWQQDVAAPTYAATTTANGMAFVGGTDFTLRALDLETGEVLWDQEMSGAVAGGAVVHTNTLIAVAGIREPGQEVEAENAGVYGFSVPTEGEETSETSATTTTTLPPLDAFAATDQDCVGAPCPFTFSLREPPAGATPAMTLEVTADPAQIEVQASGLGEPADWLRPNSPADEAGASAFAVFISKGVDNPNGGLVCVLEDDGAGGQSCTSEEIPDLDSDYDRISVLAVNDTTSLPPIAEGFDRLVDTMAFDPPLRPAG
jgi:polyvinyl alcohol dehydrogenase (cytochrome)